MASRLMSLLGDGGGTAAVVLAAAGGLGYLAWRACRGVPAQAADQPALPRLAPVDGLRALASLSLVALHTAMIATSFLKPGTADWQRVTQHPLFGVFLGGSLQTDVFLLLGGLLAGLRLRSQARRGADEGSVAKDASRRALRLWPVTLVQLVLGYLVLGEPSGRMRWVATIVATVLSFVNNYGYTSIHTSLACTPGWSVCVDFQCGLALSAAWRALRSRLPSPDSAARMLLGTAFAASLAIRASVFFGNPIAMSVIRMPMHFGQVQSGASAAWFTTHFPPFKWPIEFGKGYGTAGVPSSDVTAAAWTYLGALYFPTHARFGPYVLGALIAWCLPAPDAAPSGKAPPPPPPRSFLRSLPLVFFSLQSLATLGAAMMPPPLDVEALPPVVHAIATIAGPSLGAAAAGFLLYTALVPESSRWHNPVLRGFLSWRPFRWIADKSFALNMLHFRIILGVIFTAATLSGKQMSPEEVTWPRIIALYFGGLSVSLAAAAATGAVEAPVRGAIERALFGTGGSSTKKKV